MRSVVVFTVLRVLAFAVPFGLLLLFPAFQELPWLAAVFAAIIGLALSMLFLRRPLDAVSTGISERRASRRTARSDADVEDEVDEATRAPDAGPTGDPAVAVDPAASGSDADPDADEPAAQPTNAQNSSPA